MRDKRRKAARSQISLVFSQTSNEHIWRVPRNRIWVLQPEKLTENT